MYRSKITIIILFIFTVFAGCRRDPEIIKPVSEKPGDSTNIPTSQTKNYIEYTITNEVSGQNLVFNSTKYVNANGDTFTVSKFRYYFTNLTLVKEDNTEWKEWESYRIVDHAKSSSRFFSIDSVPDGTYKSMKFLLAVDSTRNTSGVQSGALDPANDMFWSWNQGYIFLQMEGNSANASGTGNSLIYHLGGFLPPYNCIRQVTLDFTNPVVVSSGSRSKVKISCDLNELFTGPNTIKFSVLSYSMGGSTSVTLMNNTRDMFKVTEVKNE